MLNLTPEHEDERRKLFSFPEAKVLEVKEDSILGKHYHKKKTEIFILSSGTCTLQREFVKDGKRMGFNRIKMKPGEMQVINPFYYHEFHIKKGSVLIGLNSEPFTGDDDFKL